MELVKTIRNTLDQLFRLITPPQYFSWQTLILLSVFAWLMSLLSQLDGIETIWIEAILINLAWIFLIAGVNWALIENPFKLGKISLGPWITGALVCIYLFSQGAEIYFHWAIVAWPLTSAIIAAIPRFLSGDWRFVIPAPQVRQDVVLLILTNLILSCWLQFYFQMQGWLSDYPSLLADDLDRSAFVYSLSDQPLANTRGVVLLEQAEAQMQEAIGDRPWAYAERWLYRLEEDLPALRQAALLKLTEFQENPLWQLQSDITTTNNGYTLKLQAIWTGPSSYPEGYYLEKVCQIMPQTPSAPVGVAPGADNPISQRVPPEVRSTTPMAQVQCNPVSPIQPGYPPQAESVET